MDNGSPVRFIPRPLESQNHDRNDDNRTQERVDQHVRSWNEEDVHFSLVKKKILSGRTHAAGGNPPCRCPQEKNNVSKEHKQQWEVV